MANVAASRDGSVVYIPAESRGQEHSFGSIAAARATRPWNRRWSSRGIPGCLPTVTVSRSRWDELRRSSLGPLPPRCLETSPQLTREDHNLFPIWWPDGKRILFSTRGDTNDLNVVDADKSLPEPDTLVRDSGLIWPMAWVRRQTDVVLVSPRTDGKHQDFELFQMTDRRWREWPRTRIDGFEARVSADRQWVAYTSNRSGQSEIWVRSFPEGGNPQQISREGGRDRRRQTGVSCSIERLQNDGSNRPQACPWNPP